MGKITENKRQKKDALFKSAYDLFTAKGIQSTSVADIVKDAGMAKGTFYLYFKDKYDLKTKLVAHHTNRLILRAIHAVKKSDVKGFDNQLIFIVDHIITTLLHNKPLLNLISKDLVLGTFHGIVQQTGDGEDTSKVHVEIYKMMAEDPYQYHDVDILLFTIFELAGASAYNSIMYAVPVPFDEYKPFLYKNIRTIVHSHRVEENQL